LRESFYLNVSVKIRPFSISLSKVRKNNLNATKMTSERHFWIDAHFWMDSHFWWTLIFRWTPFFLMDAHFCMYANKKNNNSYKTFSITCFSAKKLWGKFCQLYFFFVFLEVFLYYLENFCFVWGIFVFLYFFRAKKWGNYCIFSGGF
jgi:hypothetical protein